MHGELLSALCRGCGGHYPWTGELGDYPPCPGCGVAELRPDVVWFGEIPYEMDRILEALTGADLFVSIGTSGMVYPAAGFVHQARLHGARTLELNLAPSEGTTLFHESRQGPAGALVPAWVDELLAASGDRPQPRRRRLSQAPAPSSSRPSRVSGSASAGAPVSGSTPPDDGATPPWGVPPALGMVGARPGRSAPGRPVLDGDGRRAARGERPEVPVAVEHRGAGGGDVLQVLLDGDRAGHALLGAGHQGQA